MKSLKFIGSLALLTVLLVGCGGNNEETKTSQTNDGAATQNTAGADIYNQKCSSCHGEDLKGMGQDLTTVKDRLSKDEIIEVNKNGRGMMPGGQVNDEENIAVTEWLLSK